MAAFRRERKGDRKKIKPWSDLPEDLIVSIMERLYVADRIRFRAVCKKWSVQSGRDVVGAKAIDKLPWTMEYKWRNPTSRSNPWSSCKLYEPLNHNRTLSYVVETGRIDGRSSFVDAEVCASRDGWVLFQESSGEGKFFFFNPFTKEVISLPPITSAFSEVAVPTFSCAPVSPNCFVFVPLSGNGIFYAEIYSHADKAWKTYNLIPYNDRKNLGMLGAICYMKGTFYCHFTDFHLAAFDITSQEPGVAMATYLALNLHGYYWLWDFWPHKLIECDGDLLLVYVLGYCHKAYILKLDWERKEWVRMSSLEGRAIFLGNTSFCVSAGGETEIIANKVYYYRGGVPQFQTVDGYEKDSPDPDPDRDSTLPKNREVGKIKIYGCCRNSRNITWIHPPKDL